MSFRSFGQNCTSTDLWRTSDEAGDGATRNVPEMQIGEVALEPRHDWRLGFHGESIDMLAPSEARERFEASHWWFEPRLPIAASRAVRLRSDSWLTSVDRLASPLRRRACSSRGIRIDRSIASARALSE